MSVSKSSSTSNVAHAQQSDIGGTSFLDLPLELREMIYDLCAPKHGLSPLHNLPLESKPVIMGINLLQCSKQIYNEVSERLRLWDSVWTLRSMSPHASTQPTTEADISLAMSVLHDSALAKIRILHLAFHIGKNTHAMLGMYGLEVLLRLKSLSILCVVLVLESLSSITATKGSYHLKNRPFITGFVTHILPYIPCRVPQVVWCMIDSDNLMKGLEDGNIMEDIAGKYKSVKGSAYMSQQNSNSS